MRYILLIILCALALLCFPCGNEYEEDILDFNLKKPDHTAHYNYIKYQVGFDTVALSARSVELYKKLKRSVDSYYLLSDIALIDLKIGNRWKAVKTLDSLVKLYPDEYNINANLGTGYELIGNNSLALKYIQRAVEIKPSSHSYSEWIHINILKQKLKKKPDYKKILDLNVPDALNAYEFKSEASLVQKRIELAYQLNERIAFIGYEDPIVSQLLIDYADLAALTDNLLSSRTAYTKALIYSKANTTYIQQRLEEIDAIELKENLKYYVPLVFLPLILIVLLAINLLWYPKEIWWKYAIALAYSVCAFICMILITSTNELLSLASPIVQFALPAFFILAATDRIRFFYHLLLCALITLALLFISGFGWQIGNEGRGLAYFKISLPWILCMSTYITLAILYKFKNVVTKTLVSTGVIYSLYFLNVNYLDYIWPEKIKDFIMVLLAYGVLFLMFFLSSNKSATNEPTHTS